MKTILKVLVVFLLLVLSSGLTLNNLNAQTTTVLPCPTVGACTVYLMMNGIQGTNAGDWKTQVQTYGDKYLAAHNPPLNPNLVKFDSVFNDSGYYTEDLAQASAQWISQTIKQVDFSDPDFVALIDTIRLYSGNGYRVVLVGHSQATIYTNFAYEAIRDKKVFPIPTIPSLPDPTKLSIVNIASASDHVADGNGRYTTQCGDIMYIVPGSLPSNINNNGSAGCSSGLGVHPVDLHQLDSYLASGSQTQKQIYADFDLALGLPDSGCFGDANCYLKDDFENNDYLNNWKQFGDPKLAVGSTITEGSGTLRMTSYNNYTTVLTGPGIASAPAHLSLRSRRVFTGPFTLSLKYNSSGTTGTNSIALKNAQDDSAPLVPWALTADLNGTGWHTLTLTKTDTLLTRYIDGVYEASVPISSPTSGYYLGFDLQGNNTLQIQDLSVIRPPSPTMTLTPANNTVSVVQGNSVPVNLTVQGQNITAGTATLSGTCVNSSGTPQACPAGFSYSYPSTVAIPATGPAPLTITFYTTNLVTVGVYYYDWKVTLGSVVSNKVRTVVTVTAPPANQPTMTLTPMSNTLSVVRGNPVTANLVLTSRNGMTGNPAITLYCSVACPAGFTYNYTYGSTRTLLANGTLPISATFTPSSSAVLGTSNFTYWAVLNGMTVKATIAITVTAPTTTTGTVVVSTTGSVATSCALNGVSITAPVTLTNQAVGTKSLSCTAPAGYTLNSVSPTSQTLTAGGTASFVVTLTKTAITTTGTINVSTTNNIGVACTLNGANITAPTTQTGKAAGSYTLACTAPSGYTITVSPASQTLSAGGTVTFVVNLTPTPQTGTVRGTVSGYSGNVSCSLNGAGITAPFTRTNQPTGSKSLSCSAPSGYTISVSPSSQTLSAGGTATFLVTATAITPTPILNYLTVNTQPKVNTNINVSVFGSGFLFGAQGYVCTSTATNSCVMSNAVFINSTQVSMNSVRSSTARTLYLRVLNPGSILSNYLTMVVIN